MTIPIDQESLYRMWLSRIVDIHLRQTWDQKQTPGEEEEEEWFNDHWAELSETRRQRIWGLSADLESLSDCETWVESDWPAMTEADLAREQRDAFVQKDWDRLLESLRRPPRFRSRQDTDYARGRAWQELGHPEVAVLFFDNAARLDPNNPTYPALALECLMAIPDLDEALKRVERYRQVETIHSSLLFRAGDIYRETALKRSDRSGFEKAIEMIDRGFHSLEEGLDLDLYGPILKGAFLTKALSLEDLGKNPAALEVFDTAIHRFSENDTLITARGLLKQQLGHSDAMEDFRKATQLNTPLVWPYLELARDAWRRAEYEESLDWCQRGFRHADQDIIRALFCQFMAIALAELKRCDAANQNFQAALELDPLNDEIRMNQQRFETARQSGMAAAGWVIPEVDTIAALSDLVSKRPAVAEAA